MIEIPPGTGPGTVNDAFFRFVTDTGPPGPDQGQGWQVPDPSARLQWGSQSSVGGMEAEVAADDVFRRQVDQLGELVHRARLPQGRQAGLLQQVVPGRPEDLLPRQDSEPAEDGVLQRIREGVQHDSLHELQVLRRAACRHRTRADRNARTAVARTLCVHWHPEGQALCSRRRG